MPAPRLNDIVLQKRGISVEMGVLLAHYFGTSKEFFLNLQRDYDRRIALVALKPKLARIKPWAARAEPEMTADTASPLRILLADDNEDAANSLATLLGLRGHAVRVAGDGASAVELASAFRPHIALLDISMPVLDGYATAEAIRARPWGNELLLVALTGWANQADRARALKSGFDIHVAKPIDFDALDRIIGQFERGRAPS